MLDTVRYVRKPFYVQATQITAENIDEIATWCEGEVRADTDGTPFVKVRVLRPLNDRQTKAYVGDWVLFAGTGFKVYTTKAFTNSFEKVPPPTPRDVMEKWKNESPPRPIDEAVEEAKAST